MRYLTVLVLFSVNLAIFNMHGDRLRWVVYYADKEPAETFKPYDLIIFDSDAHPPLAPLRDRKRTVLGYLSIGEIEQNRRHFAAARSQGYLLHENENWKGSYFTDVRDPRWVVQIVNILVPQILNRGFDGVFLDTVDNAEHLESLEPTRFKGMNDAMANLILAIRARHPKAVIAVNRGLSILPKVENSIDIVMGESTHADWDFDAKAYRFVPENESLQQASLLRQARSRRPQLTILTLDYWNPMDPATISRIYAHQRSLGFHPYVATLELDRVVAEPN